MEYDILLSKILKYANSPRGEKYKKTMNTIQESESHDF